MMPPLRLSRLVLTVFYLAGPLLIVAELFKPALSFPTILLFLLWILLAYSSWPRPDAPPRRQPIGSLVAVLAALALCVGWVFFSGIGSYALCRWDYVKHNMLFSYLLEQKLPISILLDGTNHILHYSMAYYITPVRLYQSLAWLAPDVSLNVILFIMYSAAMFFSFRLLAGRRPVFLLALARSGQSYRRTGPPGNGRNRCLAAKCSRAIARYPHSLQSRMVGSAICSTKPDDEPLLCATTLFLRVDRHGIALCIAPVRSAIGCQSRRGRHRHCCQRFLESIRSSWSHRPGRRSVVQP